MKARFVKNRSRILALALAASMVVTVVPGSTITAFAEEATETETDTGEELPVSTAVTWSEDYVTDDEDNSLYEDYYSLSDNKTELTETESYYSLQKYVLAVTGISLSGNSSNVSVNPDDLAKLYTTKEYNTISNCYVKSWSYQWYELENDEEKLIEDATSSRLSLSESRKVEDGLTYKCVMTPKSVYISGYDADESYQYETVSEPVEPAKEQVKLTYIYTYQYTGPTESNNVEPIPDEEDEDYIYYKHNGVTYFTVSSFDEAEKTLSVTKPNGSVKDDDSSSFYYKQSGVTFDYTYVKTYADGGEKKDEELSKTGKTYFYPSNQSLYYKDDYGVIDHYTLTVTAKYGDTVLKTFQKTYNMEYTGPSADRMETEISGDYTNYYYDDGLYFTVYKFDSSNKKITVTSEDETGKDDYSCFDYEKYGVTFDYKYVKTYTDNTTADGDYGNKVYRFYPANYELAYKDGDQTIAYYTLTVTANYEGEVLATFTKKYQMVCSPIPVTTEDQTFVARKGEQKQLSVSVGANVPDKVGTVTYQWYTVDKDGNQTAIAGETSASIYVTVYDYDTKYMCEISGTEFTANYPTLTSPTVTFTPVASTGYRVKSEPNLYKDAKLGEGVSFTLDAKVDDSYTLSYQWQKAAYEKDASGNTKVVYTDLADATGATYTISATTADDFERCWDSEINSDVSYRLVVKVLSGTTEVETYNYYYRLYRSYDYFFQYDEDATNLTESATGRDGAVTGITPKQDYTFQIEGVTFKNQDDYKYTQGAYKWYQQVDAVTYTLKVDGNGTPVQDENDNYVYEAGKEIPASYAVTERVDSNQYVDGIVKSYTIYYYKELTETSNKLTLSGSNDITGKYMLRVYYTETPINADGTDGTPTTDLYITFKQELAYSSADLHAYAKNETVSAALGEAAAFEVVAENTNETLYPITYQWQKQNATTGKYENIANATSAKYAIAKVESSSYGTYRAVIKDLVDTTYVTVSLTEIQETPVFYTPSTTYYEKSVGDSVTLSVDATFPSDMTPKYIWYRTETYYQEEASSWYTWYDQISDSDWQVIGQTQKAYSFNVASEEDLVNYRCDVVYKQDGNYVTKTFYYNVQDSSYIQVERTSLETQYKQIGDAATYGVRVLTASKAIDPSKITYQWYAYDEASDGYRKIEGATASTYQIGALAAKDFNGNGIYCAIDYSDHHEQKTVYFYNSLYTDVTLAEGEEYLGVELGKDITFAPTINNPSNKSLTYQWEGPNGTIYSATNASLTIKNVGEKELGWYSCSIYESGCKILTYEVRLMKKSDVIGLSVTREKGVNYNVKVVPGKSVTLKAVATTVKEGVTLHYQWYKDDQAIGGATAATYTIPYATTAEVGTYTCKVSTAGFDTTTTTNYGQVYRTSSYDEDDDDDNYRYYTYVDGERKTLYLEYSDDEEYVFYYYDDEDEEHYITTDSDLRYIKSTTTTVTNGELRSVDFYVDLTTNLETDNGYKDADASIATPTALGSNVTLTANATIDSAYTLNYQWYKNGKRIQDAVSKTYTITNVKEEDLGYYSCTVTDPNEYQTEELSYYVYVNTGLYVEPSVYRPEAAADGSITLYVDATADKDQKISYTWYKYDDELEAYKVLTGKTSSSYKISKISTADLGKYQVVVATSGESVTYSYLVDTRYESTCSRDYAEIGDTIQNGVRIINAPSDVTFSYQWYETNGVTSDLKKVTNTTATYTTTAPKVKVSAGEYTKSVQYNCVVTPSVENAYISVGELNTDVSVFPTVTYVTSLPKFASDKRFEVKGYQLKGASEIKVTVSKGSYVTVVDAAGFAHYLDSDNRTVVLQGNKAIFIADNEYDGYQVTSIVSTTSTVTVTNKAVAYTGKAITSNTAKVTGSEGKVTYTYYTDAACTKALKKAPVNPGTYYVKATVAADSNYKAASSVAKITIRAAAQNIKVATKSQTVKAGKSFQISATAKGKLSYKKTSGNKKIKVSSTGKVKVKKGLKKGTYKIKVKISAKKTANYKAASVTKTIKVVVK